MYHKIFRAYDIRGVYGRELTEETARKLGLATGTIIQEEEFVVGRDSRWSSPALSKSFIDGFLESGKTVLNVGEVPNPVTYFACWSIKTPGVYVTASHNPPEYNGFKFIRKDGTSFINEYTFLRSVLEKEEFRHKAGGKVLQEDYLGRYLQFLHENIGEVGGVKIVAETFGGVVNKVLHELSSLTELEIKLIHPDIDPYFYGSRPEPTEKSLRKLAETVVSQKADFGVGFDGDSDRMVLVDNKGRVLNGSLTGIILVKYLVKKGDKVVLTPDTSTVLKQTIENVGGKVIWSRIGHGFIEEKVRDTGAVLGIEQSSHFYPGYLYPFSDGIFTMLLVGKIVKELGPIDSLLEDVKIPYMAKIYINAGNDLVKRKVVEEFREMFPEALVFEDGLKIFLEDGWILIRESQTMPEVNLAIEASSEKRFRELFEEYKQKIEEKIKEIKGF